MRFLLTVGLAFVGGVWVAIENPALGRTIKAYTEITWMYIGTFIGS